MLCAGLSLYGPYGGMKKIVPQRRVRWHIARWEYTDVAFMFLGPRLVLNSPAPLPFSPPDYLMVFEVMTIRHP